MDVAIALPQPDARARAVALTGWRRTIHGALHTVLAVACAAGVFAGAMVGTEVYRGAELVEQRPAGSGGWCAWLLVIGIVCGIAFVDPRRATSRATTGTLFLASVATLVGAFFWVAATIATAMLEGPWSLQWWRVPPPTHVSLWPADVFGAAVLACLLAGPLALVVHLFLFWREDRGSGAAAPALA